MSTAGNLRSAVPISADDVATSGVEDDASGERTGVPEPIVVAGSGGALASLATRARAHTATRRGRRRTRWLRTAILCSSGAIVSMASLLIGLAAAAAPLDVIIAAGLLGLVAGAATMAVNELVAVGALRDFARVDIAVEARTLAGDPRAEVDDLARIYESRGVEAALARQVAEQFSERDRQGAPLRDELGALAPLPRPLRTAGIAAASFALSAVIPLVMLFVTSSALRVPGIAAISLVSLAALSGLSAQLSDAPLGRAILRTTLRGAAAMGLTGAIGLMVGIGLG